MSSQRFGVAKLCRIGGRVSLLSPFLGLGERRKGRGEGGMARVFRGHDNMAWCLEPVRNQKSAS